MDEFGYVTKVDLDEMEARLVKKIDEKITKLSSSEVQWVKSSEVKRILTCSASTLQNLRNSGKLTFSRFGGTLYYDHFDVLKILKENKTQIDPVERKQQAKYASGEEWNFYR